MKVICAPDSFKESLDAIAVARAMAQGVRRVEPDAVVDVCPIADGGEGFACTMLEACGGQAHHHSVEGPRGQHVDAMWVMLPDRTAVIEMAQASGLERLMPHDRDPMHTSSFGTGQLMLAACQAGAKRLILGIGGSATNDGGCGMAQALGIRFFDERGQPLPRITGGNLQAIHHLDMTHLHPAIRNLPVEVACDVTNPLTGPEGASHIYGPQKGATRAMIQQLDAGLMHLAALWHTQCGKAVAQMPGAGAAGGMGGGLVAMLGATLRRGVELVLDAVRFEHRLRDCDLCITGEGKLDAQSLAGKACLGVAAAAGRHGIPTWAIVGRSEVEASVIPKLGLAHVRSISDGVSLDEAFTRTAALIADHVEALWREHPPQQPPRGTDEA